VRRRNRDGLDLDELARVAEDSYAEQRARRVVIAEEAGYLIPGGDQVTAIAAGDVHGRLKHIADRRPGLLQGDPQVPQCLAHLRADIAQGDHLPLLIERAGARREDKDVPGSLGRVGIRGAREEPGAADEVHGHAYGVCQDSAAAEDGRSDGDQRTGSGTAARAGRRFRGY